LGKKTIDRLLWFLRKTVRDAIQNGLRNRAPFEPRVYARLEDVENAIYHRDETRFEFDQSELKVHRDEATGLVVLRRMHSVLPLAVAPLATSYSTASIRILDFGGSGGSDYALVKERSAQTSIIASLIFLRSVKSGASSGPMMTASCSPKRCRRTMKGMTSFSKYKPAIILIAGSSFGPTAFVRAQTNGNVRIPQGVVSLPETECAMNGVGYKLTMRAVNEYFYNVANFDPPHRIGNNAILLFRG
jgi:hypothetical protein